MQKINEKIIKKAEGIANQEIDNANTLRDLSIISNITSRLDPDDKDYKLREKQITEEIILKKDDLTFRKQELNERNNLEKDKLKFEREKLNETIRNNGDNYSNEQDKIKIEREKLDEIIKNDKLNYSIEVRKLDIEETKVKNDLLMKKEENKIKLFTIAGTVVVAIISTAGGIIKQLISIKHSNDIYSQELYQNYHDHQICTPTQKEIERFCLNDSLKDH